MASDGSEASAAAERFGVALAARTKSRMLGLSVVEDRLARGFRDDGLGVAPPSVEPLALYLKSRAEAAFREALKVKSDYRLDPAFYPPKVVRFFNEVATGRPGTSSQ